ncbi:MAG: lectin-like protein, partial [Eubacteriales bacterium]|nr:lectin-like protein [Eubacteriales bacterium]
NGHTYYAMRTGSIDSFWDAESYCEGRGGYLAVINNASENEALYDYVFYDRGYQSAYFGYTDEDSENNWYWIDGSLNGYENWLKGQPDNSNGSEDYALFYYKDTAYKWNDGDFGKDSSGTVIFLIEWDV